VTATVQIFASSKTNPSPGAIGITLERNFSIQQYQFTPYIKGELFYDGRYDKIAKNIFTIGSVFPTSKRTEFEVFYEDQRDSSSPTDSHTRGIGLVFSLYF
jgi:hypothetical protein